MGSSNTVRYEWRGQFDNHELNRLHANAFGLPFRDDDWAVQLAEHSLGWVCAYGGPVLLGFVNIAWDGGEHAFILDTVVSPLAQHQGIGTALVLRAVDAALEAGCVWLHVDFEEHLVPFYLGACGFRTTHAGLVHLAERHVGSPSR
ncbi:GNAT family N-acetyltransferase [Ferrimicrobium sp.]|uniref:GNAT family N-acetyltransferase n=1 Tax=Ferrimicrobium sp. TaxID=2926050 RepID=UPI00261A72F3|nr:GNAT family N-acetyltransferase [Ferrimicrobium sp.]